MKTTKNIGIDMFLAALMLCRKAQEMGFLLHEKTRNENGTWWLKFRFYVTKDKSTWEEIDICPTSDYFSWMLRDKDGVVKDLDTVVEMNIVPAYEEYVLQPQDLYEDMLEDTEHRYGKICWSAPRIVKWQAPADHHGHQITYTGILTGFEMENDLIVMGPDGTVKEILGEPMTKDHLFSEWYERNAK